MGEVLLVQHLASGEYFAVKHCHVGSDHGRKVAFLAELWTWIELPRHPHLVAGRFFRTVGDEIAIFAEFVEGGSLADIFAKGGVNRPKQLLDIAIQSAWGLAALHNLGLVHQDIKPSNILIRNDGLVKITDFGLTAARALLSDWQNRPDPSASITAQTGTPQYHSPEQARGARVTGATDVWSWGWTVLEMLSGEIASRSGVLAPWVFEQFLNERGGAEPLLQHPDGIAGVLRRCFLQRPEERWGPMNEVANRLKITYRHLTGEEYPRQEPLLPPPRKKSHASPDRWTNWGFHWDDPMPYLEAAIADSGADDAEAVAQKILSAAAISRGGQALVDIALYEEVVQRNRGLVLGGRDDLKMRLYRVCCEKGFVHAYLGDVPGAQALFDAALGALASIAPQGVDEQIEAGRTYINKGSAYFDGGDLKGALGAQARAAEVFTSLVRSTDDSECCNHLAKAYLNLGNTLDGFDRYAEAVEMYVSAIDLREWLLEERQVWSVLLELGESYRNLCGTFLHGRMTKEARNLSERAIAIFSSLRKSGPNPHVDYVLGWSYVDMSKVEWQTGNYCGAIQWCEKGIALFDQLHRVQDRVEARVPFAKAIAVRAQIAEAAGRPAEAREWFKRAIDLYARLITEDGRQELEEERAGLIACFEKLVPG
jgi:tetratricopeptide (TPR) repeat protein